MHVYPDLYESFIVRAVSHLDLEQLLPLYERCSRDVTMHKRHMQEQENSVRFVQDSYQISFKVLFTQTLLTSLTKRIQREISHVVGLREWGDLTVQKRHELKAGWSKNHFPSISVMIFETQKNDGVVSYMYLYTNCR